MAETHSADQPCQNIAAIPAPLPISIIKSHHGEKNEYYGLCCQSCFPAGSSLQPSKRL